MLRLQHCSLIWLSSGTIVVIVAAIKENVEAFKENRVTFKQNGVTFKEIVRTFIENVVLFQGKRLWFTLPVPIARSIYSKTTVGLPVLRSIYSTAGQRGLSWAIAQFSKS